MYRCSLCIFFADSCFPLILNDDLSPGKSKITRKYDAQNERIILVCVQFIKNQLIA